MTEILSRDELVARIEAFDWSRRRIRDNQIHHTVQERSRVGADLAAAAAAVKRDHIAPEAAGGRGWSDTGYHLLIGQHGFAALGRDWARNPASILGHNTGAFAIAFVGDQRMEVDGPPTEAALATAVAAIAAVQEANGLPAAAITYHGEKQATLCPGDGMIPKAQLIDLVARERGLRGYRIERTGTAEVERWDGGARRTDPGESRTEANTKKAKVEAGVGLVALAANGIGQAFGGWAPWVQGILAVGALLALFLVLHRLGLIGRYRREERAEGRG